MKTAKTFVLMGVDLRAHSYFYPIYNVMKERGFNIVEHNPDSMIGDVRFLSLHNNRPTVVIGVMNDKDREMYRGIPAIHLRDDPDATVKEGDFDLGFGFTLAEIDEIIYGVQPPMVDEDYEDEEEDDDDYAPVVFSSNGCGYFGYNEAFDML